MALSYTISPPAYDFGIMASGETVAPVQFNVQNTSVPDQIVSGGWVLFGLQDGSGQVALTCGQDASVGSLVVPPSGFTLQLVFCTMGAGNGGDQLEGVNQCTYSTAFQAAWQNRAGNPSVNTVSINWVALAWTAGSNVNVTNMGTGTYVAFITDQGDPLCFFFGTVPNGGVVNPPASPAFSGSGLYICGAATTQHEGHGWQYIRECNVVGSIVSLVYDDNSGNRWNGNANVFAVYWGGNITSGPVAGGYGGTALMIPAVDGGSIMVAFYSTVLNTQPITLPPQFLTLTAIMSSVTGQPIDMGSDIAHGFTYNQMNGLTYQGQYQDASGNTWAASADVVAIAAVLPTQNIVLQSITVGPLEFTLYGLPAFPVTLAPGASTSFSVSCTAANNGNVSYPQAIVLVFNPPQQTAFIALSYQSYTMSTFFPLPGGNQRGVMVSLAGNWSANSQNLVQQITCHLPCEAEASWMKELDFDSPSANTYLSKVFVRNEPLGAVQATMTDTTSTSGVVNTVSAVSSMDDINVGLLKWLQFDFENNGEVHLLKLTIPPNGGIMSTTLYVLQYENRGPVYELAQATG